MIFTIKERTRKENSKKNNTYGAVLNSSQFKISFSVK